MRKWAFIVAGIVLLGAVVIILFTDSAPGTVVTFLRFETNHPNEFKAVFSVPGHPFRRYVRCNRVEQLDPADVVVYAASSGDPDLQRGEVAVYLPGSRLRTRVIFDVWERKFSDRVKQLTHGITTPSPGLPLSGPHYFVTNNLPAR